MGSWAAGIEPEAVWFLAFCSILLLDLVSIAALVVAIVPAEPFPPALLVGYSLTALAGVSIVVLMVDDCTCKLAQKRARSPQMVFNFYSYRKGEKGRREAPDPPKTRHR